MPLYSLNWMFFLAQGLLTEVLFFVHAACSMRHWRAQSTQDSCQQKTDARPILVKCWASVVDGVPTLNQHCSAFAATPSIQPWSTSPIFQMTVNTVTYRERRKILTKQFVQVAFCLLIRLKTSSDEESNSAAAIIRLDGHQAKAVPTSLTLWALMVTIILLNLFYYHIKYIFFGGGGVKYSVKEQEPQCFGLKLIKYVYFYPLEVVVRGNLLDGSETQLQVGRKLNDISWRFKG